MPHELPVGGSGVVVERAMASADPVLKGLIAEISAEWNYFEFMMASVYASIMGAMYLPKPAQKGSVATHPVALQIFFELDSFRAKQNLFEALLEWFMTARGGDFKGYRDKTERPLRSAADCSRV